MSILLFSVQVQTPPGHRKADVGVGTRPGFARVRLRSLHIQQAAAAAGEERRTAARKKPPVISERTRLRSETYIKTLFTGKLRSGADFRSLMGAGYSGVLVLVWQGEKLHGTLVLSVRKQSYLFIE